MQTRLFMMAVIFVAFLAVTEEQSAESDIEVDEAYLESLRTEVHPKQPPRLADRVLFRHQVVVGRAGERDLLADVFTPKQIPEAPRPAILFLHGGCWKFGSPSQFHRHANYLAGHYDFFAVSLDYRLSGEARFPAALHDAKCAMRWIRAQAGKLHIDPERIAICGGSAGGHLSSMVATTAGVKEYEGNGGWQEYASHASLAILFNGEFDLWDLVRKRSLIGAMEAFTGFSCTEKPELYDELSPIRRIHGRVPPTLLLHGTKDTCVSHEQSVAFHDALKKAGVHTELELYEGKPHAWFNQDPSLGITLSRMEKFLVARFQLQQVTEKKTRP